MKQDDQLSGAYCIFHASDHGGNSSCVCISDDSENTDAYVRRGSESICDRDDRMLSRVCTLLCTCLCRNVKKLLYDHKQ